MGVTDDTKSTEQDTFR